MESTTEYKNRFLAALVEMETHKLKKQICRPPLYRILWLFKLKVRPPLYIAGSDLFLIYSSAIALLWAAFLWILHWRHDALSLNDLTLGQIVFYSAIVGFLIGGLSTWQYAYYRRKYKLTSWSDLKLPEGQALRD